MRRSTRARPWFSCRVGWMWAGLAAVLTLVACGANDPLPTAPTEGAAAPGATEPGPVRPGRIILVSMDTVRADHVLGGSSDVTPELTTIATEGVRFSSFYAASSYTLPSTMSIFTGLDPVEHGLWTQTATLGPGVATLAEQLASAGYSTIALHEGGYVGAQYGFDRGFGQYVENEKRQLVGDLLPTVLEWVRAAGSNPYFLFFHTYAAHGPYGGFDRYRDEHPERGLPSDPELAALRQRYPRRGPGVVSAASEAPDEVRETCTFYNQLRGPSDDFLGCGYGVLSPRFRESLHFESDRAALLRSYAGRIDQIDNALGRIRNLLVELDLWDDTLLVVTSDHGEAFLEHRLYQHDHVPFDEVLKVPLVVSYPRLLRDGPVRVVDRLAWHLDLMPTVLALAGVEVPAGLRGVDLTPDLLGEAPVQPDRAIFPAVLRVARDGFGVLRRVVVDDRYKYIEGHPEYGDAEGLLFDRVGDPGETENLRRSRPEPYAERKQRAARYTEVLRRQPAIDRNTGEPITASPHAFRTTTDLPPDEIEALRALGYLE